MQPHGLSSLELMRRLVAEENRVGRTLDLHRWAAHLRTEDDIARLVRVREHPRKVLALDLDGTLWDGIIGEGEVNVRFDVVQAAHKLSAAGVLLAFVSKNEPEVFDAARTFLNTAAHRIDWNDKAANLLDIGQELSLGVDSFAFLDDSPQERDRVRMAFPYVVVMDPATDLWLLDAMLPDATTPEDEARARMYAEEREREAAKVAIPDEEEWLRSLEMHVVTRRATEADMPRVRQLFERTNQFNSHPGEPCPDGPLWIAEARDRFGDYGIVGAAAASGTTCFRFALSCRVIGKGVADVLLERTGAIFVLSDEGSTRNGPLQRWHPSSPDWITHEAR